MRCIHFAALLAAFAVLSPITTWAQAPMKTASVTADKQLADFAGNWDGKWPSGTPVSIMIEPNGKWSVDSKYGKDQGQGRIENGVFIIQYNNNSGSMKLSLVNGKLEGPTEWVSGNKSTPSSVIAERKK